MTEAGVAHSDAAGKRRPPGSPIWSRSALAATRMRSPSCTT
jgi:hypothetical protein